MRRSIVITIVLLTVLIVAGGAWATGGGKGLLYGGAGQGKVIFDGRTHAAAGFVCNDCHFQTFQTAKKALITMNDHSTGTACFSCHNGTKAFNECEKCHRKFN
jgi:phosphate transport system substrate-binding protein